MSDPDKEQPSIPLPCGLIPASVGSVGVAIYPGQSPETVLAVAAVIERELEDVDHYRARSVAREILRVIVGREHLSEGSDASVESDKLIGDGR